ncbi:MAG TPA: Hsp70 family protein [Microlunatus sp.]|nr:Hsp70 family protein [Microlunatus sp.]
MAYRLGIDLGATSVAAAVAAGGAAAKPIMLGPDRPELASTLYVTEDVSVITGPEALGHAARDPARAVLDPLRRLADDLPAFDDGTDHVAAETAVAALLGACLRTAAASQGAPPDQCLVSHPVGWDDYQRSCLQRAATEAGLPSCELVGDLEAAARGVAARADPGDGSQFLIIDLGGGSCTVGVARRAAGSVQLVDFERSDHPSGADFDEAVFRLVGGNLGDQGRELTKDDPAARARAVEVRQACRQAKEILSEATEASVTVGLSGTSRTVRIGRTEFESLVRPALRDALALANRLLARAATPATDLAGVALVGGASRMPVVAELVRREWDLPVVISSTPELDTALGLVSGAAPVGPVDFGSVVPAPVDSGSVVPVPGPPPAVPAPVVPAPVVPTPVVPAPTDPVALAPGISPGGSEDQLVPPPVPEPEPAPVAEPVAESEPAPVPEPAAVPEVDPAPVLETEHEAAGRTDQAPGFYDGPAPAPVTMGGPEPLPRTPPPVHPAPPFAAQSVPTATTAPGQSADTSTTEQPMPEHLIFDYFSAAPTEPLPAVPAGAAVASSPRTPLVAASASHPPQRPAGPPGQRPLPPGQQRPMPPGQRPGPATQPYGGGHGPGGPGGYPPQSGGGGGPFGSRRNLILAIVGAVVLVGAAVAIGFWLARPETTVTGTPPGGQVTAPTGPATPVSTPATPGTPSAPTTPLSSSPSAGGSTTPSAGASPPAAALPAGPPLAQNLVVVPMRTDDDDEDARPFYLVDVEGDSVQQLESPDGKLANPMLQKDRTSIIFLEDGTLHVMGSDGNGERDLMDRDPAGCDNVAGASWSQASPTTMVISCRLGKNNLRLLVVDTNGRLIRRLDAGEKRIDDVTVSPDGQTVLYWASDSTQGDGGSLYTLPLVGTGSPKKITSGAKGLDGDPTWSPDGSQIAFRRLVGGAGGNADVYVMNADGSGQRAVADTEAADIKPVWSPDGKNLLVVSNRKSAFGNAGKTWDLWLTRVGDGEVLDNMKLKADEITTPTWTYR